MSCWPLLALAAATVVGCDFSAGRTLDVTEAGDCVSCHAEYVEQWRGSPHAVADGSPVFEAYLERVQASWGEQAATQCRNCHAPKHSADASVTCISCHAAVGNRGVGNAQLIVDLSAPMAGPITDPAPGSPHGHRDSGFLASPDLCGTCHEVTAPLLLNEPTWSEFQQSDHAAQGKTCATCHMPERAPGPVSTHSTKDRVRHDHSFQGVDPLWNALDDADHWERVRALVDEALELTVVREGTGASVRLSNVGAGHAVPTGMATLRDLWVDVDVFAPDGTPLASLPRVLELGDQPYRGTSPVPLLTDADRIEHGSLAAGDTTTMTIDESLVGGPIGRVEATLKFRSYRDGVLSALGLSGLAPKLPTIAVATAGW